MQFSVLACPIRKEGLAAPLRQGKYAYCCLTLLVQTA